MGNPRTSLDVVARVLLGVVCGGCQLRVVGAVGGLGPGEDGLHGGVGLSGGRGLEVSHQGLQGKNIEMVLNSRGHANSKISHATH